MHARIRVLAAACAALVAASCSQQAPSEQPIAVQADAVKITLIDAGSGDKHPMRFQPTAAPQQTTLLIDDGFHQTTSTGDATPEETHTMKIPVTAEATKIEQQDNKGGSGGGDSRKVELTLGAPTYSDTTLNKELATAEGFTISWEGDDAGRKNTLVFSAPDAATDTARAATERFLQHVINLPVVFPEENIGKGAKWKVESRVTGGSTLLQTTTLTAKNVTDSTAELDVHIEQRPAESKLAIPGGDGQPDEELHTKHSTTNSQGTIRVDLNKPLPKGDVQFTTTVEYGGASDVTVTQIATTRIQFS